MKHIKMHYFTSHPDLNKFAVIPRGRDVDYSGAHKRAKFTWEPIWDREIVEAMASYPLPQISILTPQETLSGFWSITTDDKEVAPWFHLLYFL